MEYFANVFLIRPDSGAYGVVRMGGGLLHTDGEGNYSTHRVADILMPVEPSYAREYSLTGFTPSRLPAFEDEEREAVEYAWDQIIDKKYGRVD
jgi:hypothetical protein